MLRLGSPAVRRPQRLDLGGGAWVDVRVADLVDYHAALAEASEIAQAVDDGVFALKALGRDVLDTAVSAMGQTSIREWAFRLALGARCVVAWGGVGDQDGVPLPEPTPDTVKLLMADPVYAGRIVEASLRRVHEVVAEGEGSAGSRTGAPETASPTAAPAGRTATPAPSSVDPRTAGDARNASTRP